MSNKALSSDATRTDTTAPHVFEPLQGWPLLMLAIATSLSTFIEVLDITIANVSIPTIAGSLGTATNQATWIISAYAVAAAIAMPLTGWLAKRFGEVRLLVFSVLSFTLVSVFVAFSANLPMLVALRFLQGLVSGPMVPLSQTMLNRHVAQEKKGPALSLWSVTILSAPICGPLLGGHISENYHWSWIFLINVPIGIFCASMLWSLLKERDSAVAKTPIDGIGLLLMIAGVGSLQLMLEIGKEHDWFSSPMVSALAIVAVVTLAFFVVWVWWSDHPIVDLHLFKDDPNFRYGAILLSVGFMTYFGSIVVFPLWLQIVMGYSAAQAGIAVAPLGFFTLILTPLISKNILKLNLRITVTFAFLVMGSMSVWNSFLSLNADYWTIIQPRLIQGIGMACFFVPVQWLMLWDIPSDRMAAATGLSSFLRTLGGAMGTAISVTIWNSLASAHHARLSENISPYSTAAQSYIRKLEDAGLSTQQAFALVENTIKAESYMLANNDFFQYCALSFFLLAAIVWLTKKNNR